MSLFPWGQLPRVDAVWPSCRPQPPPPADQPIADEGAGFPPADQPVADEAGGEVETAEKGGGGDGDGEAETETETEIVAEVETETETEIKEGRKSPLFYFSSV